MLVKVQKTCPKKGAFFVETKGGDYYWIQNTYAKDGLGKKDPNQNFTIGHGMLDVLADAVQGEVNWQNTDALEKVPRAFEIFPYLNPKKCK